ncbi:hypothetical protein BKA62DRAFT_692212 [Auriculariales sp. MPI-PUGE-AT-0066]|nr:hypothetical protein BKA62DRAFT_692212 [Auriculariales sp. MPI-PUGE-AT-0066]
MDQLKKRFETLRNDLDEAVKRADAAEAKNKKLEQTLLEKEQALEIATRTVSRLEEETEKFSKTAKTAGDTQRNMDVRVEEADRTIKRLEQERDKFETKYEESKAALAASKKELEELVRSLDGL